MNCKLGWTAVVVAAILCGCESGDQLSGDYKLVGSINNKLPLLLMNDGECAVNLDSGSVAFRDEFKYDTRYRIVRKCPTRPDSIMPDPGAREGSYELRGDTLAFRDQTGAFAGIGFRNGDTLKITGELHTLVYVRE